MKTFSHARKAWLIISGAVILTIGFVLYTVRETEPTRAIHKSSYGGYTKNYQNEIIRPHLSIEDTRKSSALSENSAEAVPENISESLDIFLNRRKSAARELEGKARHQAILQLMSQASEQLSLDDLAVFCEHVDDVGVAATGMKWLGSRYALESPEAGFSWLSRITSDTSSAAAFSGFASSLPADAVDGALQFAMKLDNRAMITAFFSGIVAKGDPSTINKVLDVINTDPDILTGVVEIGLFPASLVNAGQYDAILPLCAKIKSQDLRRSAYRNALITIADDSPSRASELAIIIPNLEDQASVVDAVMRPWLQADPMAASEWAGKLPRGDVRDAAASSIVSSVVILNQEDAMNWAISISSKELKSQEIKKILDFAKLNNPSRVENLIKMSGEVGN